MQRYSYFFELMVFVSRKMQFFLELVYEIFYPNFFQPIYKNYLYTYVYNSDIG